MNTSELHYSSLGAYPLQLAALYIGATMKGTPTFPAIRAQHLRWWKKNGNRNVEDGDGYSSKYANFHELISFRRIAMLRAHGIKNASIRQCRMAILNHARFRKYSSQRSQSLPSALTFPKIFVKHSSRCRFHVTREFQAAEIEYLSVSDLMPLGDEDTWIMTFNRPDEPIRWEPHTG